MRQKRLVGGRAGLLVLVGVFGLPFLNYSTSLFSVAYTLATDPTTAYPDIFASEMVLVAATAILIIAGLTGVFPKGSGVLAFIGSALLIADGYVASKASTVSFTLADYGSGMYLILLATIIVFVAGFFIRSRQAVQPQPMMQPAPTWPAQPHATGAAPPASQGVRFCPNCGGQVRAGSAFCESCGTRLG